MSAGQPLKVLFVIDSLGRGGTERSVAELVPSLSHAGITPVVVIFKRHPQGFDRAVSAQGVDVRVVEERGFFSRIRAVHRIVASERPDIVHTALFDSNLIGRLASAGSRAAVMSSLVNTPYAEVRLQDPHINRGWTRAAQLIDGWTSRNLTDHFHAVSQAAKDAAIADLGIAPETVTVVERGRDPLRLGQPSVERRRQARRRLDLNDDDIVLATVGRGDHQKGHRYLLHAMEHLAGAHPRLVLLIAGRRAFASPELDRMSRESGLDGRVRWLGHRDDVPEILAAADQFVFPSLYEGLPGAVIEAMALGLPIVASNIAPLREVVDHGHNGVLVEPASGFALAQAIESLIHDRERMLAYGRRSRLIFEARFTLDRSVSRMIDLYRRVAASHGTQHQYVPVLEQSPSVGSER